MSEPLVSLLMPAYNNVAYIKKAIASVVDQTYKNWELLIRDDGSSDGTLELAEVLANKDSRIKVIDGKTNVGYNENLRLLAQEAKGEYIGTIDSDDMLERYAVEEMLIAFKNRPDVGLIYSDYVQIDKNDKTEAYCMSLDFDKNKLHQHGWRHFGMYTRKAYEEIGGYNPDLATVNGCTDGDLFMQIAEKFSIYRLPKVLYYYRNHGNNISKKNLSCDKCPGNPKCNYIRVWTGSLGWDQRTVKPLEKAA